jgi:hypothetical protein
LLSGANAEKAAGVKSIIRSLQMSQEQSPVSSQKLLTLGPQSAIVAVTFLLVSH